MKNFTITFTGIERNFDVTQSAVTRNFEIRQGVGSPGPAGAAATVSVGTTTTGNAGTNASVTNSGTSSAAVFNFTIPRGDTGATGAAGPNSVTSSTSSDGTAQLNVATIFINQGESDDSRIIIDGDDITARATAGAYTISNDEADKVATVSLDLIAIESPAGSVAIYGTGDIVATGIVSTTSHFNTRDSYRYTDSVTGNVAMVNFASLSAARTHTFPDASGTVALTSDIPDISTAVLKSQYTPAHSILAQQSGTGSPSVVTVGNNTLVGRMAGGGSNIAALSASDARAVLGLSDLATTGPNEVSITGATTLTSTAFGLIHVCSGTSADYQVDLPSVSGNAGRIITIRMSNALTRFVTIAGAGGALIDGLATRLMWAQESCVLMCDGTNWTKITGKSRPMVFSGENGAGITVANATNVPISIATILQNPTGLMNNTVSSIVVCRIRRAGVYALSALATLNRSGSFAGFEAYSMIFLNATTSLATAPAMLAVVPTAIDAGGLNTYAHVSYAVTRTLAANDYLCLGTFQNTGGNMTTRTVNVVRPNISVTEIPNW
jgi:hypothetical protein